MPKVTVAGGPSLLLREWQKPPQAPQETAGEPPRPVPPAPPPWRTAVPVPAPQ